MKHLHQLHHLIMYQATFKHLQGLLCNSLYTTLVLRKILDMMSCLHSSTRTNNKILDLNSNLFLSMKLQSIISRQCLSQQNKLKRLRNKIKVISNRPIYLLILVKDLILNLLSQKLIHHKIQAIYLRKISQLIINSH